MNIMIRIRHFLFLSLTLTLLYACGPEDMMPAIENTEVAASDYPRGPNNGRLLEDGEFSLELAIYESGVPPEFHAWGYSGGTAVTPSAIELSVTLTRLGDVLDRFDFNVQGDYLRGNGVVHEPHSFSVQVDARYQGRQHQWQYDSFEGRTTITPTMADAFGIKTEVAGSATLSQTVDVIGETHAIPESSRQISARFEGLVQAMYVGVGERVSEGQRLLTVESNSSLQPYTINSPINGTVLRRLANPGEQTNGRVLLEILDTSRVWAELAIHPTQRALVRVGMPVTVNSPISGVKVTGSIESFDLTVRPDQSIIARVPISNADNTFAPGTFIKGSIETGKFEVPLAVKRSGLQPFRDFTVVYTKVANMYEVRMLELGRQDSEWVEILGGLQPGTTYVTTNSYVLKADVEKSGASHDH